MHQKTDQVHIGDHFCSSLTMQDYLQTVDAENYTNVTLLLKELSPSILSIYMMNKRGERTHPCRSPTLTLKGFVFMLLTRKKISYYLYNNLIAVNSWSLTSYFSSTAHSLSIGTRSYAFLRSTKHYTPLWHIPTISQKLTEGQRSGPWCIFQDETRIVHPEIEV